MSASSTSKNSALHITDAVSSVVETSYPIQGASLFMPRAPLGHTLSNINNLRIPIEIALATIPTNAPNKEELTKAVRVCITGCQELLANVTQVNATTKSCADELYRLLQVVHAHLQDRQVYAKRSQLKGKVKALLGRPALPPPMYHVQLQDAFDALKNSLSFPVMLASESTTLNTQPTPAVIDLNPQNNTAQSSFAPDIVPEQVRSGASPTVLAPAAPLLLNSLPTSVTVARPSNPKQSHPAPTAAQPNHQETIAESAVILPVAPGSALSSSQRLSEKPVDEVVKPPNVIAAPKNSLWNTVADTVEGGLRLLSTLTDFIPGPAGPIVKLMAGTGLTIIETLQGMADNREEATNLGRYIGALIQTVGRFLEPTDDGTTERCDAETTKQLQSFLDDLNDLKNDLVELEGQGRFKQSVSHKTNKDDLKKCETTVSRAFSKLQAQLSLDSVRVLTKMSTSNALLERDRLISLLGDGDIGATEKASDDADLMCLPNTRTDVLNRVDRWIADPFGSRIFWISGVAGCGKSAVAATIAGRPRSIPTSIAIFYFVRGNQERNKRVLCSLSRQLARFGHGSLEHFVLSGVKAKPDIATSHLNTQFQHIIVEPLKKLVPGSPPVILVVDALDEWTGNSNGDVVKLVELIKRAHQELPSTVRFVLASRNEPHIVKSLDSYSMKPLVTQYPLDAVLKSDAGRDIRRYIEKRFTELCAHSGIDAKTWPTAGDVDNLVMLSDGLFQWAATVMSYIGGRRSQGRLREILQNPEWYRGLDNLYKGVLDGSPEEEMDKRVPRLLQTVLGAILTTPVPINATTIAYLCCDGIDTLEEISELIQEEVLPTLASMFIIPKDPTRPITVSHKSVLDYLTNKDRCTDSRFYTDIVVHSERMLYACFRLMESNLKQDICGTNDPSKLNKEVQDRVERNLPSWLRYSCQHWAAYVPSSGQVPSAELRHSLRDFSQKHLLHWLEVMSLIGLTEEVIPIARRVELWLSACPSLSPADDFTRRLWIDTQRFVAMFSDPISTAVAHIYISALRLAPTGTQLARQFAPTVKRGVRVTGGLLGKQWPPPAWIGRGHTNAVFCASFSPDGKRILSGSDDQTLRLWDTESCAQKGEPLEDHTSAVRCASFSPDGRTILSGSDDHTLRIWDSESGVQKGGTLKGHVGAVRCALFSPDGRTILSGSDDQTLRMWDAESGTQKGETLKGHTGAVWCASFSPDGSSILSGSHDHTLQLWDAESGPRKGRTLKGHTDAVWCASFSPDGKTILSGSQDHTLRLWDADSGAQKGGELKGHMGVVYCASFSPDGRTILSGSSDNTLRIWDVESGTQKGGTLKGHTGVVYCAAFSPDGRTVLSGSHDHTLRLWDVQSGAQKGRTLEGHKGRVWRASFSADGRTILSGSLDKNLRIWDADSGALKVEPRNAHTRGVSCFIFSPDGGTVVSGSYDKTVRLWDVETGTLKDELLNAEGVVSELSFSVDGVTLIGKTYDGFSQEWDLMKYGHKKASTFNNPVFKGSVTSDGWIFHRDTRWFWMPFFYADWLLCGSRLALRHERVVYIIDVSEIMYLVK